VQTDESLAAGAAVVPEAAALPSHGLFVLKIENESPIEFRFDGEWMFPNLQIPARTHIPGRCMLEANGGWQASNAEIAIPATAVGCWWYRGVDVDGNAYYFSLAVCTNTLGKTFLYASCGPPPPDLSDVYSNITSDPLHLVSKSKLNVPVVCDGCTWVTTQRGKGSNTVVSLKIQPNPKPFSALDYPAQSQSLSSKHAPSSASEPLDDTPSASSSLQVSVSSDKSTELVESSESRETGGNFMNSSRPKNIFGGFASAVKCVGAGFVAGGVALVAAPTVGYREKGIGGLFGGIVKGVVGGAALAAAGVVAGSAQVVRGVVNTPEALKQGMKSNMKWDDDLGAWVENTVAPLPTHTHLLISMRCSGAASCMMHVCLQVVLRDMIAAAEAEAKAGERPRLHGRAINSICTLHRSDSQLSSHAICR
jgi:hypothetical protein